MFGFLGFALGFQHIVEGSSATSNVRDVTDVSPMEEGSSATDSITDVTDVSPMSVGRRKKEGRSKRDLVA
ncbi:hypothetical protein QUA33_23125 [Microcoleus sp. Pol14D4]